MSTWTGGLLPCIECGRPMMTLRPATCDHCLVVMHGLKGTLGPLNDTPLGIGPLNDTPLDVQINMDSNNDIVKSCLHCDKLQKEVDRLNDLLCDVYEVIRMEF